MPLPDAVTRKVGPLPGWAWGGLALVGTYLIVRRRSKAAAGADGSQVDAAADTSGAPADQSYDGGGAGYGGAMLGGQGEDFSAIIQRLDALAAANATTGGSSSTPAGATTSAAGRLPPKVGYIVKYDPTLKTWRYSKVPVPHVPAGMRLSWTGTGYKVVKASAAPVAVGGANKIISRGVVVKTGTSPIRTAN